MSEVVGEEYGDEREPTDDEREVEGTQPGEGKNDKPSTTGTHRGWGDPQPEPKEK
jgi:hypothetical protein